MSQRKATKKDSQILEFRAQLASTFTAGAFSFSLNPTSVGSFGTRVLAVADSWAQYRVLRLRFRLRVLASGVGTQAMGFVGGVQDTPPATIQSVTELIPSCLQDAGQTVPSDWVRVPPRDLAGPLPWYKSVVGNADATEESPGIMCLAGSATDAFRFELEAVYEFKAAVGTGNTPEATALVKQLRSEKIRFETERERKMLLLKLSPAPIAATSLVPK